LTKFVADENFNLAKFLLISSCILFACLAPHAQPGSNDSTFNTYGNNSLGNGDGFNEGVLALAIDASEKILVGGGFTDYNGTPVIRITRLHANGNIDDTFDTGTGFDSWVEAINIQSDGKILVGGKFSSFNGITSNRIARLFADGSLDTSFYIGTGFNHDVHSIVTQTDGKIIVGGTFTSYNGTPVNRIVRLHTDGTIDTSFVIGTGFSSFHPSGCQINSLSIQADGKIIVGGRLSSYNGTAVHGIARLNTNGSLDTTLTHANGFNGTLLTTYIQPDGKIIAGGNFTYYKSVPIKNLARLNIDGSLDTTFSQGMGGLDDWVFSIGTQLDGKIIIGGYFFTFNGPTINGIARLNANGSIDTTFVIGSGFDVYLSSISIQPNGEIIVGGSFKSYNGTTINNIAKLYPNGLINAGFNPHKGFDDAVYSTSIQADGKIIVGGWFKYYNELSRKGIVRLNADGSADHSFNIVTGFTNRVFTTSIQSDGKIIAGGVITTVNGISSKNIVRLLHDGHIDTTFVVGSGFDGLALSSGIQADGKIIVGGMFSNYNGLPSKGIARLHADGSLDTTFNIGSGASGSVQSITIQPDGKIVAVGYFSSFNGHSRKSIFRLNLDGSLDATFAPGNGFNSYAFSTQLQPDHKIIVGGNFTAFDGNPCNYIARLHQDGTYDTTFHIGTGFDSIVRTISIQQDGKIIVGGYFKTYNGTDVNRIARLHADGTLDTTFTIGAGFNNVVYCTNIQSDGKIIVGGDFTQFDGIWRNRIARLNHDIPQDSVFVPGNDMDVLVYPNPSNGMFTVNSSINNGMIIVRDALGREVHNQQITGNTNLVNLENHRIGLYFMELRSADVSKTVRVVIAR